MIEQKLYCWTAWKEDGVIEIAGLNEEGIRIPAQSYDPAQLQLLPENAHPGLPGCTAKLCRLLSKK